MKIYKNFKAKKFNLKSKLKRFFNIAFLLVAVTAIFFLGNAVGLYQFSAAEGQEKKLPIYSVGTDEKKIAISFDAAWGNGHTGPILDILDEYNVKTTFFLVKFWADKYPDDVKEIFSRGHEVQNHSATHPDMTTLSKEKIREEVESTGSVIECLTGVKPNLFRPPFGAYSNNVIESIEELDYKVIQWSVDSLDWKEISADQIVERVVSRIKPGSIVLFHNDATHVEEYLPRILEKAINEGYEVVPIGQLIYWNNYEMDHQGQQVRNSAGGTDGTDGTDK